MYPGQPTQVGIGGAIGGFVPQVASEANTAQREPAMVTQVHRIDEQVSHILQLTQRLGDRLNTVLRPEPPMPPSPEKDSSSGVPIVQWTKEKSRQLDMIAMQLDSFLSRMEI